MDSMSRSTPAPLSPPISYAKPYSGNTVPLTREKLKQGTAFIFPLIPALGKPPARVVAFPRLKKWALSKVTHSSRSTWKISEPLCFVLFCFPILSFLLFFRFLSWNSLRKKNSSLHHLHPCDCWSRELAVDRGLAGNNKTTLLITLTVAQVRLYWTYIPQFLFIII